MPVSALFGAVAAWGHFDLHLQAMLCLANFHKVIQQRVNDFISAHPLR